MDGSEFVAVLERYADHFQVPLQRGTEVQEAVPTEGGWSLATSTGTINARAVIIATSTYQTPRLPPCAADVDPTILSLSAADYRAPNQLPAGRILVVGSAQSGGQIVEDLLRGGREVLLSVSRAGRVPRRYRGRDAIEWQDLLGFLDRPATALDDPRMRFGGEPHMTGRDGGHTVSLQHFKAQGVRLLGRIQSAEGSVLHLAPDLAVNMQSADRFSARFEADVDAYICRAGLDAPPAAPEPEHVPLREGVPAPDQIDLRSEGISTIIWATGFKFDFSWVKADVFDGFGYPVTARGETAARGLYFLGLNFLHSRKSGIIYGVGDDAAHVTGRIRAMLHNSGS